MIELLPVRAKKVAVRTRYFNYLLIRNRDRIWLQQRNGKDVWRGLYEPLLIESKAALDRKTLELEDAYKALALNGAADYEGELTQRLTHQLIHSRFFTIETLSDRPLSEVGLWVPMARLRDYAFPRSLILFFEKKGYF